MSMSCLSNCRYSFLVLYGLVFIAISSLSTASITNSIEDAEIFQYDFSWGFVTVASLEIDFTAYDSKGVIKSMGETKGLSKIFKNYSARVLIQKKGEDAQLYELEGLDSGVEETRKISFRIGELPKVLEFKDSSSKNSLTVRKNIDEGSTDPLSVLSWLFSKEVYSKGCSKTFRVFDGKKRFTVKIEPILSKTKTVDSKSRSQKIQGSETRGVAITCRITMLGRTIETMERNQKTEINSFWPFNRKDQVIDVDLGLRNSGIAYIREFVIYTPIGRIIGNIRRQ